FYPDLAEALGAASKSGSGSGVPEAIHVDRSSHIPIAIEEAKPASKEIKKAHDEATGNRHAHWGGGARPLAIGLAGVSDDEFQLRVAKRVGRECREITYDGYPISWIPTRADLERIAVPSGPIDIRPTIPPLEVLAARADEINRLL